MAFFSFIIQELKAIVEYYRSQDIQKFPENVSKAYMSDSTSVVSRLLSTTDKTSLANNLSLLFTLERLVSFRPILNSSFDCMTLAATSHLYHQKLKLADHVNGSQWNALYDILKFNIEIFSYHKNACKTQDSLFTFSRCHQYPLFTCILAILTTAIPFYYSYRRHYINPLLQ